MKIKKLGFMDDAFLRLESRRMPLHIGVLMLLEPPASAQENFTLGIAERLRQSTHAAPPFNQRLVQRRGLHYWEEDEEFDLDHHFVHLSLPRPGRVRELLEMVSRVHSAHLDREYPLWRMYLIEGLEDGRIAVYLKIHHALVDGIAGMRLLMKSMSTRAAESKKLAAPWEVRTDKSRSQYLPVPTPAADSIPALRKLSREGWKSIAPLVRELRYTYGDAGAEHPEQAECGEAPETLFNQKVSASRRFAAQSYATSRIRAVAQAYDATLNDVVLAMCAGALRGYLADQGELPDKPLIAAIPVSARRKGSHAGNELAFTLTTLATNVDDPAARLRVIKSGMDYNKERLRRLSPGQVMAYTAATMIPGQLGNLLGLSERKAMNNVVISHVPGPRRDMYWQGAKLCGLYPASLNMDGSALNITLVSRHDFVDFGLIACRKTVPSMQRLLDYLEDELKNLEASIAPPSRTRSASGKRASPGQKAKAATKKTATKKKGGKAGSKARSSGREKASPAGS